MTWHALVGMPGPSLCNNSATEVEQGLRCDVFKLTCLKQESYHCYSYYIITSFSQITQQDSLRRTWLVCAGPSDRPRAPGGGGRARRKSGIIMSELGAGLRVPGSNASVRTIPCQAMHVFLSMSVAVS